jgi:sirohydrochlorin cobaltochelatase
MAGEGRIRCSLRNGVAVLILVAHGSRDPNWRASVEHVTESLQADLGRDRVRLAYMDCAPPTLADVVSEAVGAGVAHLRVLPLFLTNEGHVDRDIRPMVEQLRGVHRSADIELLPAVGQHPLFWELLAEIAGETTD